MDFAASEASGAEGDFLVLAMLYENESSQEELGTDLEVKGELEFHRE